MAKHIAYIEEVLPTTTGHDLSPPEMATEPSAAHR